MGREPFGRGGRVEFSLLSLLLSLPGLAAEAGDALAVMSTDLEDLLSRPDALAAAAGGGAVSLAASCVTWALYVPVVARRLADLSLPAWPAAACLAPPALALLGTVAPAATAASWAASLAIGACTLYLATARGVPRPLGRRPPAAPHGRPGAVPRTR